MPMKFVWFIALFLGAEPSTAQVSKDLPQEEVTLFYSLIRQTKEFKLVKHQLDSVNEVNDPSMPQDIDMKIFKRAGDEQNYIAHAHLERRLAIGMTLDRYTFEYDRRKKQIVGVTHEKTKFSLEQH